MQTELLLNSNVKKYDFDFTSARGCSGVMPSMDLIPEVEKKSPGMCRAISPE
jgi:hypothetical protein